MSILKMLNIGALVLALGTGAAFARQATDAEVKMLGDTAAAYKDSTLKNDTQAMLDAVPPKIFSALAKMSKMDEDKIKEMTKQQISTMLTQVKFVSWDMDLDKKTAGELEDGTPYFVVPVTSVIEANGQKIKISNNMAAVLDGDKWYLITANDPMHAQILKDVYPGLEKVDFGKPSSEPVK